MPRGIRDPPRHPHPFLNAQLPFARTAITAPPPQSRRHTAIASQAHGDRLEGPWEARVVLGVGLVPLDLPAAADREALVDSDAGGTGRQWPPPISFDPRGHSARISFASTSSL
jgi:hypothetical protein